MFPSSTIYLVCSQETQMRSNCFLADYLSCNIISCSRCSFLSFHRCNNYFIHLSEVVYMSPYRNSFFLLLVQHIYFFTPLNP